MNNPVPSWLLVIDMQPAFGHPESPWFVPDYAACAENVGRLVDAFAARVLFTRFVPPDEPKGSWRSFYAEHAFALDPESSWLWELDRRWSHGRSVKSHRLSKWREAEPLLPDDAAVVMCGVATDCCVMGTALEAIDDGRNVRLAADACSAATGELHDAALKIMADRGGQIELSDTSREINNLR